MKSVKIGLAGFGTVGGGTNKVLLQNSALIAARAGVPLEIRRVVCRNVDRACAEAAPETIVSENLADIIGDPGIDIAIEVMGGTGIARTFILDAIEAGKHVVTANKALLATHGNEIFEAARRKGVTVAFEASVAGGIPIIKALREGLAANSIEWIAGIINGTSNYILSQMRDRGVSFGEALADAQRLGYAEADPTFDIEGNDAAHKLCILASLAFGIPLSYGSCHIEGISRLQAEDIRYAEDFGYRIKLLGITRRRGDGIELRVHPSLVPKRRLIANVEGVRNAVLVKGDAVGATMYYGAGAGTEPTASAVIADLVDIARAIAAGSAGRTNLSGIRTDGGSGLHLLPMSETVSSYYLRIPVEDRTGVLADVARIFADADISIETMVQHEAGIGERCTDLVFLTHSAKEGNVAAAIEKIRSLSSVSGEVIMLRKEELV